MIDDAEVEQCDCGADIVPYANDPVACDICGAYGCSQCMEYGDDVFPWTCPGGCP